MQTATEFFIQYHRSDWRDGDWRLYADVTAETIKERSHMLTDARERFGVSGSSEYHFRLIRVESQTYIEYVEN